MPKVSIIMPMLNSVQYLKECMDSVEAQTLKDLEIIVVDAGSTDGTGEALAEYAKKDGRIHLLYSEKKSMGHQYNIGIKYAAGEYVGFVESDDVIPEGMFERLYEAAEENRVDWVKANYNYFMEYPDIGRKMIPMNPNAKRVKRVFRPAMFPHYLIKEVYMWAGIYRREFLVENRIHLNETAGASFQDTGFVLQTYMLAETALYIDDYLYCYRRDNANSSAHQMKSIKFEIDEIEFMDKMFHKNKKMPEVFESYLYERALNYFFIFYKKLPGRELWSAEIHDAVCRYRKYLLEQHKAGKAARRSVTWHYYLQELQWLREGLDSLEYHLKQLNGLKRQFFEERLREILEHETVVIFGCGDIGTGLASVLLRLKKTRICCFLDNDERKWNQRLLGIPVLPPSSAPDYGEELFLIANEDYYTEIWEQLRQMGIESDQIWAAPRITKDRGTNLLRAGEILPDE